ncbi:alpha-xylosidase [Spirochaetia bacterium]|nr:alpha-xylosidase [Spirochaetia bacterium]
MKFRDGYWEIRNGVHPQNLADNVDIDVSDTALTVYTTNKKLKCPGERVTGIPLLTTVFSSPMPDVIRVRMYHFKGGLRRPPEFALPRDSAEHISITEDTGAWTLRAGALAVSTAKDAWQTTFSRNGKELTGISGRNSGYFLIDGAVPLYSGAFNSDTAANSIAAQNSTSLPGDTGTFMAQYLNITVGETIYGLGERFTSFVKNGQIVECWNEDGGTATQQAYKNIPFYLSSRAYGVLVNSPGRVSFEIASEVVSAVQFSVPGELIDYYIIAGDSLKDVIRNYTALTGRPALPPAWSFGLWLSTSFTTDYDEKTVNRFVDGMTERKIPLRVFHFDCFWMKGHQWVDFEWDKEQFPDPAAMLRRLKQKGLNICIWINPYVAQKSPLFDECAAKGYLLKRANGDVWQWDRWQPGMALIDFTKPGAVAWYRAKLASLLDMGVDCFKTDFGERIPTDAVYYNGAESRGMHNYYTYLYNKTVFELLEEKRGKGEALVFARSATVGGQRFPVHWGGDCAATYESMAESLRGGLSLALTGFGFWSHDISGFENTATADLFKRWAAFGLLSSHSRLHGNQTYRVPWNFDDEACDVLRFFTELKCRLMPYLWRKTVESHQEGIPLMRAMVLEFPGDPACAWLDRQYLLGDSLLAAPIFSNDGNVSYYLPAGRWTNIISGEVFDEGGGSWRSEHHSYASLPLLARPNSLIPFGNNSRRPDYDYADGVCFHVFELDDGKTAEAQIFNLAGELESTCRVSRKGAVYTVNNEGAAKPWKLLLRGIHEGKAVDGTAKGGKAELPVEDTKEGLLVGAGPGNKDIDKFSKKR